MISSPICLLSKASKTKSWLWHRRLSHLNFGTINQLAKQGLLRVLPNMKYEKDHLCSACSFGKSKKHTHKPKSEDSIQEKLYLLHMDLCGPMRVESINGKKYILVIVDDYSRKPDLKYFHVFGALCYPTNDIEDLGKLKPKANIVNAACAQLQLLSDYYCWKEYADKDEIKDLLENKNTYEDNNKLLYYALWEVIVNGDSSPPKRTIDGVEQTYPHTTA
ncbi:integrase, catalytic region, zinc finger, CCHC-type containing protein [Tanacetum coccineum]